MPEPSLLGGQSTTATRLGAGDDLRDACVAESDDLRDGAVAQAGLVRGSDGPVAVGTSGAVLVGDGGEAGGVVGHVESVENLTPSGNLCTKLHMTSTATQFTVNKGDAIYAKRAGNKTYAWYVIDRPIPPQAIHEGTGYVSAYAHREYGAKRDEYMLFTDVKHHDKERWA